MRENIVTMTDSEDERSYGSESSEEESPDDWTTDEEGISDDRWERRRTWECDITVEEDEEHEHLYEEWCRESREVLTRKAKLRAENAELMEIVRDQDECLARMEEATKLIKRKTAERRAELATLRADRARRARENAPRPG